MMKVWRGISRKVQVAFTGLSQDLKKFPDFFFLTICDHFSCGRLVELRNKFENTSIFVYRRGVSITTKGQFLIYLGQRIFY